MQQYELKVFAPKIGLTRPAPVKHSYPAPHNLAAIEHAKAVFDEDISACSWAEIHHQGDGLIWEWYAPASAE